MNEEKGKCYICNKEITKQASLKHVKSCINKNISGENKSILVQIFGGADFYLLIVVPIKYTLYDLDDFLKEVWYECCGHISWFEFPKSKNVGQNLFSLDFEEEEDKIKSKYVIELKKYKQVEYCYDGGSTNYAKIKFIDIVKTNVEIKDFKVLSNNLIPTVNCKFCQNNAKYLIGNFEEEKCYFVCEDHLDENDDDLSINELFNNPRVGYCGDSPDTDKIIKKYIWKND